MRESPTLLELDPQDREELEKHIGLLGRLRFPRIRRLIMHEGEGFDFLDGADCSWLTHEIVKLRGGRIAKLRRSITDHLRRKLVELSQMAWPEPYQLRFLVARRNKGQRLLSLSVLEMLNNGEGLSGEAQSDLANALGFFPRGFRYLRELKPASGYPGPDRVLDTAKTKELIAEIHLLLSQDNPNSRKVKPQLAEELKGILPILDKALKEGLYVWLSQA